MNEVTTPPKESTPPKKKTVSHSQFANWYKCPNKWRLDYIEKQKEFEDNLIMTFGTAIHETIQLYLKTLFNKSEKDAERMDQMKYFKWAFKRQINIKKIPHTQAEFDEFVEDGLNILTEFKVPYNRLRHFPRDKWELLGIEDELKMDMRNNVSITGLLDIVFKEKATGNIRIVDFKTSNRGWTNHNKEDFTKTSQLLLYKALYSKKHNIPLSKINVEFFVLKRKLYDDCNYEQSRIQIFKPAAFQSDVLEVIQEFGKFVDTCFTPDGQYNTEIKYPKNPGKAKANCKYCPYIKNGKCDAKKEMS